MFLGGFKGCIRLLIIYKAIKYAYRFKGKITWAWDNTWDSIIFVLLKP
jgi:hypothetical protein